MIEYSSYFFYMICFIVSSIIIANAQDAKSNAQKISMLALGFSIPVAIATFRDGVGTDFYTYFYLYKYQGAMSISSYVAQNSIKELIAYLIYKTAFLFKSFNIMLFLYSFGTVVFSYLAIEKLVPKQLIFISYFSYLSIFFLQSLNIMRQGLVIAIFFYSVYYILERNLRKYLLLIIFGGLIHASMIIVLPIYFVLDKEGNLDKRIVSLSVAFLSLFALNYRIVISLISGNSSFERYNSYLVNAGEGANLDNVLKAFFLIVMLYLYKKIDIKQKNIVALCLLFGFILGLIGFSSAYLKRFGLFFDVFQVIAIAYFGTLIKNRYDFHLYKGAVIIIVMVYVFLLYVLKQNGAVVPYHFNWHFVGL